MGETLKFQLSEEEIPASWVNLLADLPGDPPPPPLSPATGEPVGPDDLAPIFPMGLIEQEVSTDPDIAIPDEVRDIYRLWRPTPLLRRDGSNGSSIPRPTSTTSTRGSLRPALTSPTPRSPRPSTTARRGSRRSRPRPGRGSGDRRWRSPANFFGLECEVFMVGISYDQKPYRKAMIETWAEPSTAAPPI